ALNLYTIRKAKGSAGDFFRAVQKQRPAQYQGLYLVSPQGKVLSSMGKSAEGRAWVKLTLETIDDALHVFGPITPRTVEPSDPLPYRGVGEQKDGRITLALYTRGMLLGFDRRGLGSVTIDSVLLTPDERASLTLDELHGESRWTVPSQT